MAETKKTSDDSRYKNTKWLASFFKLSERRIQQLTQDGILPSVKRTREGNLYDLIPTIQRYIYFLQDTVNNRTKSTEEQERDKLDAEIRLKQAKADMAQIDLKILKSEVLVAEDVQAFVEDLAATTKSLLLGLPGRLAMDLENVDSAAERSDIIEKVLISVLDELKHYEFTVDYYKKRVAERKGRSVKDDEDLDDE